MLTFIFSFYLQFKKFKNYIILYKNINILILINIKI